LVLSIIEFLRDPRKIDIFDNEMNALVLL